MTMSLIMEVEVGQPTATAVKLVDGKARFSISTNSWPTRVMLSPADAVLCNTGVSYALSSFMEELESTLIVYGTGEERASNLEAAQELQRAVITQHSNKTIPYMSDKEVSQEDLKTHHLLLIGRPDNNSVLAAMRDTLPVTFGPRSIKVQGEIYANPGTAVLAASPNPNNGRYSAVVISGLSAEATFHAAPGLMNRGIPTQVLVLPARASSKGIVVEPVALVENLSDGPRPNQTIRTRALGGARK
jgi:hypothetical protein